MRHLFPVGEVNGSHGVYRPGGSALNSGQCGSLRAAQYIAARYGDAPLDERQFAAAVEAQVKQKTEMIAELASAGATLKAQLGGATAPQLSSASDANISAELVEYRRRLQARMTAAGAHMRNLAKVTSALADARTQLAQWSSVKAATPADLLYALKNRDAMIAQLVYLAAIEEYLRKGGTSRGSYMVLSKDGQLPCEGLGDDFRFVLGEDLLREKVSQAAYDAASGLVSVTWTDRRPIPGDNSWFENVWGDYRADKVIR